MSKAAIVGICLGLAIQSERPSANFVEVWPPIELSELVLKDPSVQQYFHLEQPGRHPILVSSMLQHPDLERLVIGYAIKVVPAESAEASRAFQFTKVNCSGDHATIEFAYPPEGLRGRFKFLHSADGWSISARRLWEH